MKSRSIRYLLLGIFNCVSLGIQSQVFTVEELTHEKSMDRRIEMWAGSKDYFLKNNLDSLLIFGVQLTDAQIEKFKSFGLRTLGSYYIRTNDINKGIDLLLKAQELFVNEKLKVLASETENELGNAYYFLGDYVRASEHYRESLIYGESTSDPTSRYNGMYGFGRSLCASGDTIKGKLFVQTFLEYCLNDEKFGSAADACGYLGMLAGLEGKIELMTAYYSRAARYALKTGTKMHRANAYTNSAISAYYKGNLELTIQKFESALKLRKEIGESRPIAESMYNLGVLYLETHDIDKAKYYTDLGEKLSAEAGLRAMQLDCLILLLEIEEKRNNLQVLDQIQMDINRLKRELKEMSKIEEDIIDSVIDITSLNDPEPERNNLLHLSMLSLIIASAGLLLYQNRFNSI